MKILLVEDDNANAKLVAKLLNSEGYSVDTATTAKEAQKSLDTAHYALIVLDWNLPDGCGYALLLEVRELGIDSQVLMLSANSEIEHRVQALNGGADDYLCKPYSQIELLARINSLLRRSTTQKSSSVTLGNITIDRNAKTLTKAQQSIDLTQAEYLIIEALAFNPNKIFSKFELSNLLHSEYDNSAMSNVIEVHVKNIRKKTGVKELIKTVRNVGYKIGSL